MQAPSQSTVLVKQTLLPFAIPAAFIALAVAVGLGFAAVADAGEGWPTALGSLIAGAIGVLTVGLLFWSSDRTVVFNGASRQVEVYRHRLAKSPRAAYPASQFRMIRVSKVRIRSIYLSRVELISSKEPLRLMDHRQGDLINSIAKTASQLLGLPIDDQSDIRR